MGQGVALPGCSGGPRSGGSALLVVDFSVLVSILLCSLSMSGAALEHPAQGGVTFPGILFMTWRAQGVMNGWHLCSCTGCAVTRRLVQTVQ